jgi:hypothetical protein
MTPLTDEEIAHLRGLLAVIAASGLTPEQIVSTLQRGKLTTEREAAQARIRELTKARDAQHQQTERAIADELAKVAAINEALES